MNPRDPIQLGLLLAALVAVAALLIALWLVRSRRAGAGTIVRGIRNGGIVALAIFIGVAALVTLLTVGRPLLFGAALTLEGAATLGALVAAPLAVGYLLIGLLVMVVGLALRTPAPPAWARRDAWIVTPLVAVLGIAALGFASGLGELAQRPITRAGQVSLLVEGPDTARAIAHGQARCTLEDESNLAIHAGAGEGVALLADDGRRVSIQFGLPADAEPGLVIGVGEQEAASARSPSAVVRLEPGSSRFAGELTFSGLAPIVAGEPDTANAWRGRFSWQCSF